VRNITGETTSKGDIMGRPRKTPLEEVKARNIQKKSEWYQKNKERLDIKQKEYCQKNKEHIKIMQNKHYKKNKESMNADSRKNHQENRERNNAISKKYYQANRESSKTRSVERRRKTKLNLVKQFGGLCMICGGEFPPCCMDFHHKDPKIKERDIGKYMNSKKLLKEIVKCTMVCSNCHRIIHHGLKTLL